MEIYTQKRDPLTITDDTNLKREKIVFESRGKFFTSPKGLALMFVFSPIPLHECL